MLLIYTYRRAYWCTLFSFILTAPFKIYVVVIMPSISGSSQATSFLSVFYKAVIHIYSFLMLVTCLNSRRKLFLRFLLEIVYVRYNMGSFGHKVNVWCNTVDTVFTQECSVLIHAITKHFGALVLVQSFRLLFS